MHTLGGCWLLFAKLLCRSCSSLRSDQQLHSQKIWAVLFKAFINLIGENGSTLNLFPLTFMVLNFPAFLLTDLFLSVSFLSCSFNSHRRWCLRALLFNLVFLFSSHSLNVWEWQCPIPSVSFPSPRSGTPTGCWFPSRSPTWPSSWILFP